MKTPTLLFCLALGLPFAAVACPIGMQFNGNGCSPPYEYTGWDMLRDRRAAIDAIGADRPRSNGRVRSKEELAHLESLRVKVEKEKEAKRAELAKGVWGVESTSTPEGKLCAATFAKQDTNNEGVTGGLVTIMGFQKPKPDAWLIFHGAGLPKPRGVEKLKISLQQDDEPAQTVQVFNYRYGTSREIGVVAFAVPGLAAALDGMRDNQSFKLSLDGKTLMTLQWTDGAKVIQQLKQCAA
jgi:hypothetical protein